MQQFHTIPVVLLGVLLFLASTALSLLLTRGLITVLPLFGLVDIPRGRHQHEKVVPRGGGLAFIITFALITALYFMLTGGLDVEGGSVILRKKLLFQLGIPLFAITVLGVFDDRFELSSKLKLFVQLLIAVFFYFSGAGFVTLLGFSLPVYIALPLTVVWVIGITNAFNLIDGMDGVAAGLASISAFSLAIWFFISGASPDNLMFMIIFCGALLGFLKYNFSPAKIFMGDTGSLFIGTFFAYFSMMESVKTVTFTSLLVPVLAMGVPIFDVFLAICRRLSRKYIHKEPGVGVMTGDHDHIHHRIQDETKDQKKTAYTMYILAFLMAGGAMCAVFVGDRMRFLSFAILLTVLFFVVRFATIEFYDAATIFSRGIKIPYKKYLFTAIHPLMDVFLLFTAYMLIAHLFKNEEDFAPWTVKQILCYLAPYPVVLGLSGVYRTYWLRSGIGQFFKLFLMYALASVIVLGTVLYVAAGKELGFGREFILLRQFYGLYVLLGGVFIFVERFFLHYLASAGVKMLGARVEGRNAEIKNTILYGGGLYCRLFLIAQYSANGQRAERKVVGVIDDDPSLRGLNVYGLDVLGNSDELPTIRKKLAFDEIVIALKAVTEENRKKLYDFGKANDIKVQEFRLELDELEYEKNNPETENNSR